ncbi:helix-turn-helix domain-containing protein [Amycolatopsis japonica]|uniref:helix-turn-helix domain-containing protein n=1 Tax=Amycolatopsis japonica TaxID=208439 RepID=UPI00366BD0DC
MTDRTAPHDTTPLSRAAEPVLERFAAELDGSPVALVLADHTAKVVGVRSANRSFHRTIEGLGITPGVSFGEDEIGVNAVGTPVETRHGLLVRGAEHSLASFHTFTCYGHPIVHPITRRLEGVLGIGRPSGEDDRLFPPLVQRMVRDIEDRLQLASPSTQRRLLTAFQQAARRRDRPVIVLGEGLVLATPAALDLLQPADHVAVRACAEQAPARPGETQHLDLASGRAVAVRCAPIDGGHGVLVDILADAPAHRHDRDREQGWPLLVVGEAGSGRTTTAKAATSHEPTTLDAAEIVRSGERSWATTMDETLTSPGQAVVVENAQLLSERMIALLVERLRVTPRQVVVVSTPDGLPAPLAGLCARRRDLVPLRRRQHEIPRLAQRMLDDVAGQGRTRLTADTLSVLTAQPWPGNLSELRRVVQAIVEVRSAGDVLPSDLPDSHRGRWSPDSPLRQAEREVIVAAIQAAGGNKQRAATALGVSRSTLYNRIRALRIG